MIKYILITYLLFVWSCVDNDYNPYIKKQNDYYYTRYDQSYSKDSTTPIRITSGYKKYYASYQDDYGAFYFRCAAGDSFKLTIFNPDRYDRTYRYYGLSIGSNHIDIQNSDIFDSLVIYNKARYDSIAFIVNRRNYASYAIDLSFNHNSWESYQDDSVGGISYTSATLLDTGLTDSLKFKVPDWYKFSVAKNSFVLATVRNSDDFNLSLYSSNSGPTLVRYGNKDSYYITTREQDVHLKVDYYQDLTFGYLPLYYNLYFHSQTIPDSVLRAPVNAQTVIVDSQKYNNLFVRKSSTYSFTVSDSGNYSIIYSDVSNYGMASIYFSQNAIRRETTYYPYVNETIVKLTAGYALTINVYKDDDFPTPFCLSIKKVN